MCNQTISVRTEIDDITVGGFVSRQHSDISMHMADARFGRDKLWTGDVMDTKDLVILELDEEISQQERERRCHLSQEQTAKRKKGQLNDWGEQTVKARERSINEL